VIEPWATKTSIEGELTARATGQLRPMRRPSPATATAFDAAMAAGDTAEDVAATVLAAAQDRAPRLRYPSGKAARKTDLLSRGASCPARCSTACLRKQFNIA
jgi:hypothetical protein